MSIEVREARCTPYVEEYNNLKVESSEVKIRRKFALPKSNVDFLRTSTTYVHHHSDGRMRGARTIRSTHFAKLRHTSNEIIATDSFAGVLHYCSTKSFDTINI